MRVGADHEARAAVAEMARWPFSPRWPRSAHVDQDRRIRGRRRSAKLGQRRVGMRCEGASQALSRMKTLPWTWTTPTRRPSCQVEEVGKPCAPAPRAAGGIIAAGAGSAGRDRSRMSMSRWSQAWSPRVRQSAPAAKKDARPGPLLRPNPPAAFSALTTTEIEGEPRPFSASASRSSTSLAAGLADHIAKECQSHRRDNRLLRAKMKARAHRLRARAELFRPGRGLYSSGWPKIREPIWSAGSGLPFQPGSRSKAGPLAPAQWTGCQAPEGTRILPSPAR